MWKRQNKKLKGIKMDKLKNCCEQWEKVPIGVLHQMESALEETEVETCKNKYTTFYKFRFLGSPPTPKQLKAHISFCFGFSHGQLCLLTHAPSVLLYGAPCAVPPALGRAVCPLLSGLRHDSHSGTDA